MRQKILAPSVKQRAAAVVAGIAPYVEYAGNSGMIIKQGVQVAQAVYSNRDRLKLGAMDAVAQASMRC